jgi:hypothetical protein
MVEVRAMATTPPVPVSRPVQATRWQLVHEIVSVVEDVPRFATAPLYRHWHQRWGATRAETAAAMPGDDLIGGAQYRATRAITIDAPPEDVWPWLVQVGCLRAGWYSNDLLDNLAHPSAEEVIAELQDVHVGQWVPMSPTPSEKTAFKVAAFDPNRSLLWEQPVSTWAWTLTPVGAGRTRLVTRLRIRYDWHDPAGALLSLLLNELGDFPMMRRMLLGIKRRAEATARRQPNDAPHRRQGSQ